MQPVRCTQIQAAVRRADAPWLRSPTAPTGSGGGGGTTSSSASCRTVTRQTDCSGCFLCFVPGTQTVSAHVRRFLHLTHACSSTPDQPQFCRTDLQRHMSLSTFVRHVRHARDNQELTPERDQGSGPRAPARLPAGSSPARRRCGCRARPGPRARARAAAAWAWPALTCSARRPACAAWRAARPTRPCCRPPARPGAPTVKRWGSTAGASTPSACCA